MCVSVPVQLDGLDIIFWICTLVSMTENSIHEWQGVRLRVVGVSDSKSLLLASDVFTRELDDTFLNEVSRVKLGGSSLKTLSSFGNSIISCCSERSGLSQYISFIYALFYCKKLLFILLSSSSLIW